MISRKISEGESSIDWNQVIQMTGFGIAILSFFLSVTSSKKLDEMYAAAKRRK